MWTISKSPLLLMVALVAAACSSDSEPLPGGEVRVSAADPSVDHLDPGRIESALSELGVVRASSLALQLARHSRQAEEWDGAIRRRLGRRILTSLKESNADAVSLSIWLHAVAKCRLLGWEDRDVLLAPELWGQGGSHVHMCQLVVSIWRRLGEAPDSEVVLGFMEGSTRLDAVASDKAFAMVAVASSCRSASRRSDRLRQLMVSGDTNVKQQIAIEMVRWRCVPCAVDDRMAVIEALVDGQEWVLATAALSVMGPIGVSDAERLLAITRRATLQWQRIDGLSDCIKRFQEFVAMGRVDAAWLGLAMQGMIDVLDVQSMNLLMLEMINEMLASVDVRRVGVMPEAVASFHRVRERAIKDLGVW